nr:MAG TPA: hypothetical protein [Caudoviricetes sp.]
MSKFYDYIKSKEKEIGKDFFCNIEIGKTEQEDKVIIYYRSFSFNKDEKEKQKKEEGLRYLILNNPRSIDVFVSYGDLYISTKHAESYVKEGKRLKKLFKVKELREFEKRNENE